MGAASLRGGVPRGVCPMPDPPLEYAGMEDATPLPRRTLGTWVRLLLVWTVGLLVWAFYIAVLLYLFVNVFG